MQGDQIHTVKQIHNLAIQRRSITGPSVIFSQGPLPASFIINMQGIRILQLIDRGLFIYEKQNKQESMNNG